MTKKNDDVSARIGQTKNASTLQHASANEKAAATPGPWRVEPEYDDGRMVAARVMPPEPFTGPMIAYCGSKLANARLIAAAPDLYEACELAERAFRVPAGTDLTAELAALVALRAAIAKAEGR